MTTQLVLLANSFVENDWLAWVNVSTICFGVAGIVIVFMVVRKLAGGSSKQTIAAADKSYAPIEPNRISELESEADAYRPAEGIFGGLTPALAAQIPESRKESGDFAKLLRQAGIYSPSAITSIYALRFLLLFLPLVLAGVLAILSPPAYTFRIMLIGGVLAALLSIVPRLYVYFRRRKRQAQMRVGLADMMDMLSMCMSGGMPLSPSLEYVAKHMTHCPPLAEELLILKRQSEVSSLKIALADMADRIDLPEMRQVASQLMRGEQLGSKISGSMMETADHFRVSRRQLATLQANKTPVKLTLPLMFCFAPAALIILIAPALMELRDFFHPQEGQSVIASNQGLDPAANIRGTLDGLNQDLSAANTRPVEFNRTAIPRFSPEMTPRFAGNGVPEFQPVPPVSTTTPAQRTAPRPAQRSRNVAPPADRAFTP